MTFLKENVWVVSFVAVFFSTRFHLLTIGFHAKELMIYPEGQRDKGHGDKIRG
jgi:hypothetical protein